MAQAERSALTVAPRQIMPRLYGGTESSWRVLCDLYPSAETPEVIMAVVEYCAAKRLDPFARPVHIVPMYNSKLRRRVQVVMRGINEIETIASRTGKWAGVDLPVWGREVEYTFAGVAENEDGSKREVSTTLKFPDSCSLTTYRFQNGEKRAFSAQLYWMECYGTAGFRSTIPNERWTKAPRQMLHKCTLAAVLRMAFPEADLGYSAEEMEDREVDAGGITIDGVVHHGDADVARDRQAALDRTAARAFPPKEAPPPPDLSMLDRSSGDDWLRALIKLLAEATTEEAVVAIGGHRTVARSIENAPTLIVAQIKDTLAAAHRRVTGGADEQTASADTAPRGSLPEDPAEFAEMLARIDAHDDVQTLNAMAISAPWLKARGELFPLDMERLDEAIVERRAILTRGATP